MLDRRSRVIVGLSVLLLAALVLAAPALADRAFNPRFTANASGDIAVIGNTLETCQSAAAGCGLARGATGSTLNNNGFAMERVDVDSDAATFDSSSARLALPDGARVLFAGLYYGSRTTAGTRGKAAPHAAASALGKVELRPPGHSGYERLSGVLDESSVVTGAYGVFVDVSGQVRRAGSGVYTVANVQSATGEDRYAGWSLVVAYEAAADPPRNLTVFDGLQSVTQGKPALTIPVSGFQTPLSGAVRTKLGFVAYEGDLGLKGDSAALDGKALTDARNPANNFFNSGITIDGREFTAKTPDYANQLGFDAKLTRVDGILANGATSATIALKTSSDQYLPQVITFATDLYAPVVRATKTVANLTHPDGPTRPGDALRYTVTYTNHGLEPATNFVADDPLPAGITYLSGTLSIPTAPAGEHAPSDITGDDLGEYHAAHRTVRFFLGAGAAAGRGGTLAIGGAPGDRVQVSFEARVDPDTSGEREITDVAQAAFHASNLGAELTAVSSPAMVTLTPEPAPIKTAELAVGQTETVAPDPTGDKVDDHVLIDNHGPDDATDVVLHETVPPGAIVETATADQGTCTLTGTDVACRLPRLDSGGSAEIDIVEQVPAGAAAAGSVNEATVSAAQFDPRPGDNSGEATARQPVAPAGSSAVADLTVDAVVSAARVPLGGTVEKTITVRNAGPASATGVDITDVLGVPARVQRVAGGAASCTVGEPLRCTLANLPAGATQRIVLVLRPLRPGVLLDAVGVSGAQLDPNYANNVGKAVAQVSTRSTAARIRIVAIRPVANPGQRVGFVITASVAKPTPGLSPVLCVALPAGLRLRSAPGATRRGSRLCWNLHELISGRAQSFRVNAMVTARAGATLALHAQLTGTNFATRAAATAVDVPPAPVACASRAHPPPRAKIAC
jgi:large repetitive protein